MQVLFWRLAQCSTQGHMLMGCFWLDPRTVTLWGLYSDGCRHLWFLLPDVKCPEKPVWPRHEVITHRDRGPGTSWGLGYGAEVGSDVLLGFLCEHQGRYICD